MPVIVGFSRHLHTPGKGNLGWGVASIQMAWGHVCEALLWRWEGLALSVGSTFPGQVGRIRKVAGLRAGSEPINSSFPTSPASIATSKFSAWASALASVSDGLQCVTTINTFLHTLLPPVFYHTTEKEAWGYCWVGTGFLCGVGETFWKLGVIVA